MGVVILTNCCEKASLRSKRPIYAFLVIARRRISGFFEYWFHLSHMEESRASSEGALGTWQ
jgi:hypothetical protein